MEDCEKVEPSIGRDDSFTGREFRRRFDGPGNGFDGNMQEMRTDEPHLSRTALAVYLALRPVKRRPDVVASDIASNWPLRLPVNSCLSGAKWRKKSKSITIGRHI